MTERSWWPEGYTLPAFRVRRETYESEKGGDWVRGSSVETLPHTALRYPRTTLLPEDLLGKSILFTRALKDPTDSGVENYYSTVEILWSWPTHIQDTWKEVALVRSTFGHPSTPRDGQTVVRGVRADFEAKIEGKTVLLPPPDTYDKLLPPGCWYYYTLFFRLSDNLWHGLMSDACLLPRDYEHREHMWNVVPPYYQWVDDNQRVQEGYLRQFLNVYGFVLDNTREFIESYLDLYRIDRTPMALLKGLGANFDMPYESGIGDIRYRGLIAQAHNLQHTRGTAVGLEQVIEAVSKFQTEVTGSTTLLLHPDDSEFYRSTGNWGGLHPDSLAPVQAQEPALVTLPWNKVFLAKVHTDPPTKSGRGVMRVYTSKADAAGELVIAVGDSRIRVPEPSMLEIDQDTVPLLPVPEYRDVVPVAGGVTVRPGDLYGFSIWVQTPEHSGLEGNAMVQPAIIWVGRTGQPHQVLDVSMGNPLSTGGTTWKQYKVQGAAPKFGVEYATDLTYDDDARYLIPAIHFFGRTAKASLTNRSAAIDLAGAVVYLLSEEGVAVSIDSPDAYLSLGDVKKIGDPDAPEAAGYPGFIGYPMGSPKRPPGS